MKPPCKRLLQLKVAALMTGLTIHAASGEDPWVTYAGGAGPGQGRHIVLVSGDEEYRSEEALPQLGKILAEHHGFRCTVLFAIDPNSGHINPNVSTNLPGLQQLADADLMILFTRFRALPDEQMQHIDDYLKSGRPVVGIRTATHAFRFEGGPWEHYGNGYQGEKRAWTDGFGRAILGEKWISHHGHHRHQSTRGIIAKGAQDHPIVRGIRDGDIWGPSDVYEVRLPLPGDSRPIVLGQVVDRVGEYDETDPFFGMKSSDDRVATENPRRKDGGNPNQPMMPVAWTKTYQIPAGKPGRVFASTIGASTDLAAVGTRRMFVNAVYWCLDMADQIPPEGTEVDLVGPYEPTAYQVHRGNYWQDRQLKVSELRADE